jgi:transposase
VKKVKSPKVIEFKEEQIGEVLERAKKGVLSETDYQFIETVLNAYLTLLQLIGKGRTTISRLQRIIFGQKSEKSSAVLRKKSEKKLKVPKEKPKGHGRNDATSYTGAKKVFLKHESLEPGDRCPECKKGRVYEQRKPGVLVRFTGQAPVQAIIYEPQKLRCNLCGEIFTAEVPEEAKKAKYDEKVSSIIALEKYGAGLPFNRIDRLQANLGIPLPSSNQWEIIDSAYKLITPVHGELIRQAAGGKVLHNDDTNMKILELCGKRLEEHIAAGEHTGERTGVYTSGIISKIGEQKIALFFTGNKHAGENLAAVLQQRESNLPPPIQMCDALSRNMPKELKTIIANCNCHGRRNFVDVLDNFPGECEYVLKVFREIYKNDALAKEQNMSPTQRLAFHKKNSTPVMEEFYDWLQQQFEQKKVEPNSTLGEAITYMLKHWEKLTLFLRKAGAPLDNNICERALKKAILHRKNSLFYKTEKGARVGDAFMSLIYTAELAGANAFDYLNGLQLHPDQVALSPSDWMPWNYKDSCAALSEQKIA